MTGLFAEQLALMIVSCCFNDIVKINPSELSNLVDGLMNRLKNIFQENISAEDKTNSIYTIVNKYATLLWQNQGRTITDKVLSNKFVLEDIYACPNFILLNEILMNGGKNCIESKRSRLTPSLVNRKLTQRGDNPLFISAGGETKIPTVGIQAITIQLKQTESRLKKVEEENQQLIQICVRQELRIRALEEQNEIYQPSEADLNYPSSIGFFGKRHGFLTEIRTDSNFNREMLRVGYD